MTALLIDTHIFIWARTRPATLTAGEKRALDAAFPVYVSIVSLWEIAILQGRRRIDDHAALLDVPEEFSLLAVSPDHCKAVLSLPRLHGDPYDRMLIAQSHLEHVPLLTRDRIVAMYRDQATILRLPEA